MRDGRSPSPTDLTHSNVGHISRASGQPGCGLRHILSGVVGFGKRLEHRGKLGSALDGLRCSAEPISKIGLDAQTDEQQRPAERAGLQNNEIVLRRMSTPARSCMMGRRASLSFLSHDPHCAVQVRDQCGSSSGCGERNGRADVEVFRISPPFIPSANPPRGKTSWTRPLIGYFGTCCAGSAMSQPDPTNAEMGGAGVGQRCTGP
jgi:hypothetical protein